jgi:hypothetical protein
VEMGSVLEGRSTELFLSEPFGSVPSLIRRFEQLTLLIRPGIPRRAVRASPCTLPRRCSSLTLHVAVSAMASLEARFDGVEGASEGLEVP